MRHWGQQHHQSAADLCSYLLQNLCKEKTFSALLDCAVGQAVGSAWSSHPLWPAWGRFGSGAMAHCSSSFCTQETLKWYLAHFSCHYRLLSNLISLCIWSTQTGTSQQRHFPGTFPWATMISQGQWDLKLLNKVSPLCLVFSFAVRLPFHRECN